MTLKIKQMPRSVLKGKLTRMGKDGVDGTDGAPGPIGPMGPQGPQGAQGPPGLAGGPDPLFLTQGLSVNAFNPTFQGDPNLRETLFVRHTTDCSTSNPGFTDENAIEIELFALHGQNTQAAKRTFLPINVSSMYYGAGQKFVSASTLTSYSMGDTATWGQNLVQWAGGPIGGDEGIGWQLVALNTQQPHLTLATITAVPTPATLNTTTTQSITASKDPQTVAVASSTGAHVGDWLVIQQEVGNASPKMEAVQLTGVAPGTITAVFWNDHPNGTTVKPALLLSFDTTGEFGQDRYLINLTKPAVTAGTVTGTSSGGTVFVGTGTSWSNSMVGGNGLNVGMISLAADDNTTGGSFNSTDHRLRDWYSITSVPDATHVGIHSFSVAADFHYKGKGPGSGAYTIRQSAKLLRREVGGAVNVFENSTSTWSVGDSVELVICPYPDVSYWQYQIACWSNGGTLRGFHGVNNNGNRMIGTGYSVNPGFYTGTGDADPAAWDIGFSASTCNTGMQISSPLKQAILLVGASPGDNRSKIAWDAGSQFIGQDSTNSGFQWKTLTGAGDSGRLQFSAQSTPLNPDAASPAITWRGIIQLASDDPTVEPKLELSSTRLGAADFTKGGMYYGPGSGGLGIYTRSGGSNGPCPINFLVNGVSKLLLEPNVNVATFSFLAVALQPIAFASRASSPTNGMVAVFTDSTTATWGATITGGGSNKVLAWYNGSNWTVIGA